MTETTKLPKLTYTVREACEVSGLSKTTIFQHIKEGRLHTRRVGGRTLIPCAELRMFLLGEAEQ
jgi:excisionase family DNA binding protein